MSVIPGCPGSELIAELPDPPPAEGSVLVEGLLAGICGTDAEILRGGGQPPAGGPRGGLRPATLRPGLGGPSGAPGPPRAPAARPGRRPRPAPLPAPCA